MRVPSEKEGFDPKQINRLQAESSSGDEELSRRQRRSIWNPTLSSTLLNSKRQLQNPPFWMGRSPPFRRSLAPCQRVSWRCVQGSLQSFSRQYVRMTPKETVNESAVGWLWEETFIAEAEVEAESSLHSSTASGDFLHPAVLPTTRKDPITGKQVFEILSSRLSLAEMTLATRVTRLWSSGMARPWTVSLGVLWRASWR